MTVLATPDKTGSGFPLGFDTILDPSPLQYLDEHGALSGALRDDALELEPKELLATWRAMVIGRRFDVQATTMVRQGRLAVYPSSFGQEACEIGAILALRPTDWFFPTYRDCVSMVTRGIDPVQTLTLLRGDWHCGYDPQQWRTAPQTTPLATQGPHAAGLALAAKLAGDDTVALAFCGDGGTSEGDFHEALNFAAVYQAPAIFFVQNNQYAISVPLAKQTHAAALAHKAVGYGMAGVRVDGNDVIAVRHVVAEAAERARRGQGPTLIEAVTYRMQAHTNADDASRYRDESEVEYWKVRDPLARLETYLRAAGLLTDEAVAEANQAAEDLAAEMRTRLGEEPEVDHRELFAHVYAEPTPQLLEQAAALQAELDAEQLDADQVDSAQSDAESEAGR
ncbi:pyruvate dehydrogenase (acetyl-transferring) E1 component subunit alpha [Catenulispora pinisilvae]|uniref:pyruvate dehydrogenase (acetyl-transferring) E1 component subunit alpha n=1 Tax=Catenulispora pinisilvae TaxID=2705253 RepID=UPI002B270D8F|nr:pyruvate dehydrogenase (acetyl-transferring) E1 component subunit alpha [Catenulispora pinisilvae]